MKALGIVLSLLVVGLAYGVANAATLFLDDFEAEPSCALNHASFTKWTVSNGSVDSVNNACAGTSTSNSTIFVDLDGSTSDAGRMETISSFSLSAGVLYTLQFDLAGNNRNVGPDTVNLTFAGTTTPFTLPGAADFTTQTIMVTPPADTTSTIVFDHLGGDNIGLLLDNVILSDSLVAVPEPGTFLLLGTALLAAMSLYKSRGVRAPA